MGLKGDDHCFLIFKGSIYIEYLEKGRKVTGPYYAVLLGQTNAGMPKKTAPLYEGRNALPPWQRTSSHCSLCHIQIGRIE